jgi:hypothetical protein
MNYSRWLKITTLFTAFLLMLIVVLNISIDTYGVYSSLFNINKNKKISHAIFPVELNQRIYIPELIFCNPERFDSFLFGTSRVSVIDTSKITTGRFYNMSYPQGVLAEHLAIIKTFLHKGIKIKNVIIGLDEFTFISRMREHEDQLLTIMHPDVSGKSPATIFLKYFLRVPRPFELSNGFKFLIKNNAELKAKINDAGLNLGWLNKEKEIDAAGKPLFLNEPFLYSPFIFNRQLVNEVFTQIDEMKILAKQNNFSLIFFFNPIYAQRYASYATGFLPIKEELAKHTDFYDFSGFNSVTTNNFNYYEEHHYRYLIADMIVQRIFRNGNISVPDDFGILVTKNNVLIHINKQRLEMGKYLAGKVTK